MDEKELKLFAVYLGGRAPGCNTELHDMVFTVGATIEDTYEQLLDLWFGDAKRLHLDAWTHLDVVDGYEVRLTKQKPQTEQKLFFVNLGAYQPGQLIELHENTFLVGNDRQAIKRRAKSILCQNLTQVHTDDLYDIDDCLEITEVAGLHVDLVPTAKKQSLNIFAEYKVIPKKIIDAYLLAQV